MRREEEVEELGVGAGIEFGVGVGMEFGVGAGMEFGVGVGRWSRCSVCLK